MVQRSGWIKLHRKLAEWEWYHDTNCVRVWLHLLLTVNHETKKFAGHEIPAGSVVSGRKALASAVGLSEQKVRTVLDKLKSTNEITIKSTNQFTIISITCWDQYQAIQPADNQRATNEQPTDNQRITTTKEEKKERSKEVIGAQDAPKARGSRLSKDWTLPDEYRTWAIAQGFPSASVDAEADRFRDYWISKSGQGATKTDWLATWRNWIRNSNGFKRRSAENVTAIRPSDEVRLLNHNTASRQSAISKLRRWFSGEMRNEWRFTPAWGDTHPPGHPDCVFPDHLIEEARRLAAKQRATA